MGVINKKLLYSFWPSFLLKLYTVQVLSTENCAGLSMTRIPTACSPDPRVAASMMGLQPQLARGTKRQVQPYQLRAKAKPKRGVHLAAAGYWDRGHHGPGRSPILHAQK